VARGAGDAQCIQALARYAPDPIPSPDVSAAPDGPSRADSREVLPRETQPRSHAAVGGVLARHWVAACVCAKIWSVPVRNLRLPVGLSCQGFAVDPRFTCRFDLEMPSAPRKLLSDAHPGGHRLVMTFFHREPVCDGLRTPRDLVNKGGCSMDIVGLCGGLFSMGFDPSADEQRFQIRTPGI